LCSNIHLCSKPIHVKHSWDNDCRIQIHRGVFLNVTSIQWRNWLIC
jgi:hypothetical protein